MNRRRNKANFSLIILCFILCFLSFGPGNKALADDIYYFQWFGQASEPDQPGLTGIQAYPQENSDIVELYGVELSGIQAFVEGNLLVITMQDVPLAMNTQYYSNESNPCLAYCLVKELPSRTVIHFMLNEGSTYQMMQVQDCVRIIFSATNIFPDEETLPEDSKGFEESSDTDNSVNLPSEFPEDNPDAPTEEIEDLENLYADKIRIPLPEEGIASVSTKDNYLDLNFKFMLSGNLISFFKENAILNPYDCIQNHTIYYDMTSDKTIVTFNTRYVCGYTYELIDNYLIVKVGKPSEIYSKIVLLDAGHGGIDPGAVKNGIKEKDINFAILNSYANKVFYNTDIKVYFTRESDSFVDLYARAAYAEQVQADLFISLHANANNSSSVTGTEVFYSNANNAVAFNGLTSSALAKALVNNIAPVMKTKNRGANPADFIVIKYNTIPAVLIELGFMTNATELSKLTNATYQNNVAKAICQTVIEIFEEYPTGR